VGGNLGEDANITLAGNVRVMNTLTVTTGTTSLSPTVVFDMASYNLDVLSSALIMGSSGSGSGQTVFKAGTGTFTVSGIGTRIGVGAGTAGGGVHFYGGSSTINLRGTVYPIYLQNENSGTASTTFFAENSTLTVTADSGTISLLHSAGTGTTTFDGGTATITFNGDTQIGPDDGIGGDGGNVFIFNGGTSGTTTFTGGYALFSLESERAGSHMTFNGQSKNFVFEDLTIQTWSGGGGTDYVGDVLFTPSTANTFVEGNFAFQSVPNMTADASMEFLDPESEYTIRVEGNVDVNDAGGPGVFVFAPTKGTFLLASTTGSQYVAASTTIGSENFNNITINNTAGTGNNEVEFSGNVDIQGNLTIESGVANITEDVIVIGSISNSGTITESTGVLKKASTSLSLNTSEYVAGNTISITLIDQDENLLGTSADTVGGITATISSGSDSETITLTENGNSTATFTGTLSTSATTGTGVNDGVLYVPTSGDFTITYVDPNDSSDTRSIARTISVASPGAVIIGFLGTNNTLTTTPQTPLIPTPTPETPATTTDPLASIRAIINPIIASLLTGPIQLNTTNTQNRILQFLLAGDKEIYPEGLITGYYGPLTKAAVQRFQLKYGVTTATDPYYGYAGPATRAKVREVLGR
jgi:hypothetical protein